MLKLDIDRSIASISSVDETLVEEFTYIVRLRDNIELILYTARVVINSEYISEEVYPLKTLRNIASHIDESKGPIDNALYEEVADELFPGKDSYYVPSGDNFWWLYNNK